MTSRAIPLQDLAHRISQQQAEVEQLRKEYEARQSQMRKLMRRKEELQGQLQQVEAEIQGIDRGGMPPTSKSAATKPAPKPATKSAGGLSLAQLLIRIVGKAGRPITVKELTTELVRRKYPTTSQNLAALVEKRVNELVKKGLLRRAKDQPGVLPAKLPASVPTPAAKPASSSPPTSAKPAPLTPAAAGTDLSLTAVVTKILANSSRPLTARELAEKVLAAGYQTKSKNFTNVIWAGMGKMDNVENVQGKGYRLKKGKSVTPESKGTPSK